MICVTLFQNIVDYYLDDMIANFSNIQFINTYEKDVEGYKRNLNDLNVELVRNNESLGIPNVFYYYGEGIDWFVNSINGNESDMEIVYPLFEKMESEREIDIEIYNNLLKTYQNLTQPHFIGAFVFEKIDSFGIEYIVQFEKYVKVKKQIGSVAELKLEMAGIDISEMSAQTGTSTFYCLLLGNLMQSRECQNILQNGMVAMINNKYILNATAGNPHYVHSKISQIPYKGESFDFTIDLKTYGGNMFMSILILFLLAPFMFSLVNDKQTKSRELMSLNGMNYFIYVLANYITMFMTFLVIMSIFGFACVVIFQYRLYSQSNLLILFIVIVISGLNLISFSFFLSAFFWKTLTSTVVGYIFTLYCPIIMMMVLRLIYNPEMIFWKFFGIVFPFSIVEMIFWMTGKCETICFKEFSEIFSHNDFLISLCFTIFNIFFYLILGMFLDSYLKQPFGVRKKIDFDFVLKYFKRKKKLEFKTRIPLNEDEMVRKEREKVVKEKINKDEYSIIINGLSKKYDKYSKNAVDGIHLAVKKNELFGLLGENGAGKTTLLNCISGVHSITNGNVSMNGFDVSTQMNSIRSSLGLVPQFNILFPDLTPREHLLFYLRFKDYPFKDGKKHVNDVMEMIGLTKLLKERKKPNFYRFIPKILHPLINFISPIDKIKHLSGGMKRLTQIGIALLGNPHLIIMDEPSTGLDVPSRRKVWDIILREKKNRTIILSTHSMEEADLLSDRICILANGRIKVLGDQIYLKEHYGIGYSLKLKSNKKDELIHFINELIPNVKLYKSFGNTFIFQIEEFKGVTISTIFKEVESKRKELEISEWEILQSNLDDVFLKSISKVDKYEEETAVEISPKKEKNVELNENEHPVTTVSQVSVKVKIKSNGGIKEYLMNYIVDVFWETMYLTKKNILLYYRNKSCLVFLFVFPVIIMVFIWFLFWAGTLGREHKSYIHPPTFTENELIKCKCWYGKKCYDFFYTTNNNEFAARVMNDIIDQENIKNNRYREFEYEEEMLSYVYRNPNITSTLISFSNTTKYLDYSNFTEYVIYFNSTNLKQLRGDIKQQNILYFQILIDNTILYLSKIDIGDSNSTRNSIDVKFKSFPMIAKEKDHISYDIYKGGGPMFISVAFGMLLSISSYFLVTEKEKKLRDFFRGLGVRKSSYWFSWYILFIFWSLVYTILIIVSGIIFRMPVFINVNFFILFFHYFLYSCSLNMSAFFLVSLVNTKKSMLGLIAVVLILLMVTCAFLDGTMFYSLYSDKDDWSTIMFLYFAALFYPPINFSKIYADEFFKSIPKYDYVERKEIWNSYYGWDDLFVENRIPDFDLDGNPAPPSYESFLFLFVNIIFLFLISYYIDTIVSDKQKLWFFILPSYWIKMDSTREINQNLERKTDEEIEKLDEDVLNEYNAIRDPKRKDEFSLRILNLKKTYRKFHFFKHVYAVKGIDIGMKKNQILSLLGNNGTGKTSILDCVKGTISFDNGDVMIDKTSSKKNDNEIRKKLGFCNQFNDLYDQLTAKEHLTLVGGLKKVPNRKIIIDTFLEKVGLFTKKDDLVSTYSGGMKRRLNCVMSFLGSSGEEIGSKVILLDEPTTGLDPKTKRNVWRLIWDFKKDKSILLTTHSINEAEYLSNKIVIMVKGKICAVGNTLHLKSKYQVGYNLTLVSKCNVNEKFEKEIMKILPKDSELIKHNGLNYVYYICQDKVGELSKYIKDIEKTIDNPENDWLDKFAISSTTLESVYVKVNQNYNQVS